MDCKVTERGNEQVMVSICCLAYNHEKYIGRCLDSFLAQKTDFAYEVLIHDDASADGTAEIIKDYAERYPNLIKPIFQSVNQYSQGICITRKFQHPRIRGKYVALCEGDDYWCDEKKLQTQVSYMENHKECSMTCSAIQRIDGDGVFLRNESIKEEDCDLETTDVIERGGYYISTPSIVVKSSIYVDTPEFRTIADVEDYPLQLLAAAKGSIHYFAAPMAAWRTAHEGSWSYKQNQKVNLNHFYCEDRWLREFDRYFQYQYHAAVLNRLLLWSKKYAKYDSAIEEIYRGYLAEKEGEQ